MRVVSCVVYLVVAGILCVPCATLVRGEILINILSQFVFPGRSGKCGEQCHSTVEDLEAVVVRAREAAAALAVATEDQEGKSRASIGHR